MGKFLRKTLSLEPQFLKQLPIKIHMGKIHLHVETETVHTAKEAFP